jgi:hypothetical protein
MATVAEGLVEALSGELANVKARVEAATSAGINTAILKRKLVRIESELAAATKRATEEFHAGPSRPAASRSPSPVAQGSTGRFRAAFSSGST